jgi:hypothetical protein
MKHESDIVFLTVIAGRKQKDALLSALLNAGIHLINTVYGRGTVSASLLKSALGLIPEEHKVVITCVSTQPKIEAVFALLIEKFHFDRPNTGIAFTTRVDKLSY